MIDSRNLAAFANPATSEMPFEAMDMAAEPGEVDKFDELRPALEEFVTEIEECCNDLDPEVLRDPGAEMDSADIEILQQGVSTLDSKLQQMLQSATGISPTEAADIGMHLEAEGRSPDGDRLAGWLYRVGQHTSVGRLETALLG